MDANRCVPWAQRSPGVGASRLSSFQSQTRTGTVAGRFTGLAPPKADSVSPLPACIALQGGETRRRRCDVSLPSTRRRHLREPCWLGPLQPGLGINPSQTHWPDYPYAIRAQTHEFRVLAEPFNNNKICTAGQRIVGLGADMDRSSGPASQPPVSGQVSAGPRTPSILDSSFISGRQQSRLLLHRSFRVSQCGR